MPHSTSRTRSLFRHADDHRAAKVSMVELFFDLVFVFAITQLSHSLLARLTPLGAVQTVMLLLAVWSLWSYTAWATNVLDPERIPVRLLLFALMLLGLVVSTSIPSAFNGGASSFAIGYVLMHTLRCSFVLGAARDEAPNRRQNFRRNLFWVVVPAPLWFAGALAGPEQRLVWWMAAIGIEFISPWLLFWTPGLGRSKTTEWVVDGAHMAERCALFVIIALGESLLITGATFAAEPFTARGAAGLASAFFATVAMWWIYFHEGAEHAARQMAKAVDPGRVARVAYSYLHIAIVAGIIVSAVADEIVLVHPGHAGAAAMAAVIGGPALFLLGCTLFKWVSYDRSTPPLSHSVGLLALGALFAVAQAQGFSTLQLGIVTAAILVLVAVWETLALRRP
ncbi:MAG: low temperature requirement protein A [Burkholderiaceae bacterium]